MKLEFNTDWGLSLYIIKGFLSTSDSQFISKTGVIYINLMDILNFEFTLRCLEMIMNLLWLIKGNIAFVVS